jgi:hypothetical protein
MAVKKKAGPKIGRPTKYDPKRLPDIFKFVLLGATDQELADFLGVAMANLYKWKQRYPEFRDTLLRAKEGANADVAHALYQRAKGYKHRATKIFFNADLAREQIALAAARGEAPPAEPGVVKVDYVERYAPETSAIAMFLTNRSPDKWKYRQNVKVDAKVESQVTHTIEWDAAPGCEPLTAPEQLENTQEDGQP